MADLQFQVLIDPDHETRVAGVVAIGDFELAEGDTIGVLYNSNTALEDLYQDLLLGRPLPMTLVMREMLSVGSFLVLALFLRRDLCLHPRTGSMIAAAARVDRLRLAGLAHIDQDLVRFFKVLSAYLPSKLTRKEQRERLLTAVEWVAEYVLDDRMPALPPQSEPPRVLETGTGGFVVAEAAPGAGLDESWVDLFRAGYLWGVVFTPPVDGRRKALAGRKSPYNPLDPALAASHLNQAEAAMGEPPTWQGNDLWMSGPPAGTLLPIESVVKVLIYR